MTTAEANALIILAAAVALAESDIHWHHKTLEQVFACKCSEFLNS